MEEIFKTDESFSQFQADCSNNPYGCDEYKVSEELVKAFKEGN